MRYIYDDYNDDNDGIRRGRTVRTEMFVCAMVHGCYLRNDN
jgi:hypothetical protein